MEKTKQRKRGSIFQFIIEKRALALLILILLFCLAFTLLFPDTFGTLGNFSGILLNMSAEGLIVVAIVPLLIVGEIDLSLGAVMVLGSILCGRLMILDDMNMWLAILISLGVSVLCGLINGIIVAKINVVSFIATLATSMIYLGIAVMLAGTGWTDFPDPLFRTLGQGKVLNIQLPVIYVIVVFIIMSLLISRTRYFRQCYYIGGNAKAAELSAINTGKTKIVLYMIASGMACISGIISAMRFNSALTSIGAGVEMRAVTAAVIGGVCFTGGAGTMAGAAMGALFVACLNNALTIASISQNMQNVITGVVLILAIVLDVVLAKKKAE